MPNLKNEIGNFTLFWEIKNPQYCTMSVEQSIKSPIFYLPHFWNTKWSLVLFPNGEIKEYKRNTTLYLRRENDNGPHMSEITHTGSLSSREGEYSSTNIFKKFDCRGYFDFLPYPLNEVDEKSVVITMKMHCKSRSTRTSEEMQQSSGNNYLLFPRQYFAQTKFSYEKKSSQWSIDTLINSTCSHIAIPVILKDKFPSLIVNMQNNPEDTIDVYVSLVESETRHSFIIICEMSVVNRAGQVLHSFEETPTFRAGKADIWPLAKNMNRSHLKSFLCDSSLNNIFFKGDFSFSVGNYNSEVVDVNYHNVVSVKGYQPSNEILHMYKENKLCDFSIRVGTATFDVHKVVLGSVSPVFYTMFTTDMNENKNNFVDIVDLDKDTVEEMLSFIYTGSVKELEYESAKRLFIAGDKYHILPLLDLVRDIMIGHINRSTICDILLLAFTHNDKKLENEAIKFIKLNKTTVLNSSQWTSFVGENGNLAAEILKQVCLLNERKWS